MITALDFLVAALAGAAWRELFQTAHEIIKAFHRDRA